MPPHPHYCFTIIKVGELPLVYVILRQLSLGCHHHLVRNQLGCLLVKVFKNHVDITHLQYNPSYRQKLKMTNLSIKWEIVEQVSTMELFAVCLHHGDSVVTSFKYLHLVHRLQPAPGEVALPGDEDCILHPLNGYLLIEVSVLKETFQLDNLSRGKENSLTLKIIKGIQRD